MRMLAAGVLVLGIVAGARGQATATRPATGPASRVAAEKVTDEAVKAYAEAIVADRRMRQEGIQEKIADSKVFIAQAEAGKIAGYTSVTPGKKPVYVYKDAATKAQVVKGLKEDLARFIEDAKPVDRPWTVDEPVNVRRATKEGELASFPKPVQVLAIRGKEYVVGGGWVEVSQDRRSHRAHMEPRVVRGIMLKDVKELEARPIPGIFVAVGKEKVELKVGPPVSLVVVPVDAKVIGPRINAAIKEVASSR